MTLLKQSTINLAIPPTMTRLLDNVAGNGSSPSTPPTNWTGSFTPSQSGDVRITAACNIAANTGGAIITANLRVDGSIVASTSQFYFTGAGHVGPVPIIYSGHLTAGAHTIDITLTGTSPFEDSNGFATILVEEYPLGAGSGGTTSYIELGSDLHITSVDPSYTDVLTLVVSGTAFDIHGLIGALSDGGMTPRARITVDGVAKQPHFTNGCTVASAGVEINCLAIVTGLSAGSHTIKLQACVGNSGFTINANSNPNHENAILVVRSL